MLSLAWSTLRARKGAFAGAFVALMCASALVTACGVLLETGLRGDIAAERYAGAPIIVGADQQVHWTEHKKDKVKTKSKPLTERAWLPADTVDRLQKLPGVEKVTPEVTFPARTGRGTAQGHAWDSAALTPFTLAAGRAPRTDGEVVVDARAGLRPGATVIVSATAEAKTYTVVGVTAQALPSQGSLFFSGAEALRLAGRPGQVSAIGVFPASAEKAVRDALRGTPAKVYTGDARGPLEFIDASKARVTLISMGGALGGTSLLVAILVVVGTFALSIEQRRRELALLRAVAATPRQLRRMIGREALLVGLAAGLLGAVAGLALARALRSLFLHYGVMPQNLGLVLSPFPMAAGLGATLLAGWAAARLSARRTARIRPAEALAEAAMERRRPPWARTLIGLVVLAAHITLLAVLQGLDTEAAATPVTFLAVVLAAVAVALLGPVIARVAMTLLAVPLRLSRVSGHLAAANTTANTRRLASVITPLTLAVGMACTILFVPATVGDAATRQAREGAKAEIVLAGRVPHTATDAARALPGVRAVTEIVPSTIRVGRGKYAAQGVTPEGLGQTIDPGVRAGSLDRLAEGTMAVSATAAGHMHARLGDEMRLTLGDGTPARARVTAIYDRGLGFGDVLLPYGVVAAHVDDPLPRQVLVAGGSADALREAVRAHPGVQVLTSEQAQTLRKAQQSQNTEVNLVVMGLIIAFTAIAIVNTLAMATAERNREFALLRLIGTTRRQILRMLRLETLVVALVGILLGTGIALATLAAYGAGMTGAARPAFPPLIYLAVIAAGALLALVATAVPARLALTADPAEAIGSRED
ncbi:FtsX-like permease family protein [Actinomadura alba]|uniref:ABC transporter permease n=1 Tax=Actinomadura alba TaxID=406431 RepID=A0ABR7LPB0_9ACTN|nr:ABC transporter permease [Actinomadura alba]MBC6466213.1 ABC transporter permease [Actinomadura alba]